MAMKPYRTSQGETLMSSISRQIGTIGTYWHTIRYLKLSQIIARIRFRLAKPHPRHVSSGVCHPSGEWIRPADRTISMVGPNRFTFLNSTHDLDEIGWDNPAIDKLWRYNLHYFDDLAAKDAAARSTAHRALIERWIAENPPANGSGWEPYPVSLRIVNWIKWLLAGNTSSPVLLNSLATQADWLTKRLEYHLMGNHLFVNAKALVFAGLFFKGADADRWLRLGLNLLHQEIEAQILTDGGHFELSPMYHALILEDVLDLYNVCRAYSHRLHGRNAIQQELALRMLRWLSVMTHPDGKIAFFNDAAFGVAPKLSELTDYAERLGLQKPAELTDEIIHLAESGYIRIQQDRIVALLDVGQIGPHHQPGHAHADTLSFELSIDNVRVLVNTGTSEYGIGPERLRQRGTDAHNTVVVDGCNSSEVWGGFRVARRAEPQELSLERSKRDITVTCSHDGYRRLSGNVVHTRRWHFAPDCLTITDKFSGRVCKAASKLHANPEIYFRHVQDHEFIGKIGEQSVRISFSAPSVPGLENTTWHPEFGHSLPNQSLSAASSGEPITTSIRW